MFVGHIKCIVNEWKYLAKVWQVNNSEIRLWFDDYMANDGNKTISYIYNDLYTFNLLLKI